MATAPTASIDGRAGAHSDGRRLWQAVLLFYVVLIGLHELGLRDDTTFIALVIWAGIAFAAPVAIVVGVLRYRPGAPWAWFCLALGLLGFALGDLVWDAYEVGNEEAPFPSLADVFYLVGYPFLAAGFLLAARARKREVTRGLVTDALTISVVAALVLWVYVAKPILGDAGFTTLDKALSVAYPAGDMLLLAAAAWLLVGSRMDSFSMRVLLLGPFCTLVADVVYYAATGQGWVVDPLLAAGLACYAVAAVHPSMTDLTNPEEEHGRGQDRKQLVFVALSALVPLGVVALQHLRGEELYLPAVFVALAALVILAAIRADSMLREANAVSERDATLARFTAELLSSDGRRQLVSAADESVKRLVSRGAVHEIGADGDGAGSEHTFLAPVRVGSDTVAEVVADVGRRELGRTRSILETVAAQLALAFEREQLLEHEREHSQELFEQNERLMELDEMKNRFVSSTSHELRTPLTSMVGYLELVLDEEVGTLTDEQREFLEIVKRNSDRLNKLVDDLLFMGRADSGRLEFEPTDVDLAELARAAAQSASAAASAKGVQVECHAPGTATVVGDPVRLAQLVDNLISNAVKFTPGGGSVTVAVDTDDEAAHVAVRDTGVGIPEDELPHIFERFFRASTTATMPGTGIGLSIVHFIADAHGGSVAVESEVGEGTTFTVTLPLHPPPECLVARTAAERMTM